MFGPVIPSQRLRNPLPTGLHPSARQTGQSQRITLACRIATIIAIPLSPVISGARAPVQIHLVERLLHVLDFGATATHQIVTPHVAAGDTIRVGGPE